jgi:hypothetical protein
MDLYKDGIVEFIAFINSGEHRKFVKDVYVKYLRDNSGRIIHNNPHKLMDLAISLFDEKNAEYEKLAKITAENTISNNIYENALKSYKSHAGENADIDLFNKQYDVIAPITRKFVDNDLKAYLPCFHIVALEYSKKIQSFKIEYVFAQRLINWLNMMMMGLNYCLLHCC